MRRAAPFLVAAILVVGLVLLAGSARENGLTVDEAHYIGLGRRLVERGDWTIDGAMLHPPLPFYLNSLLLARLPIPDTVWSAPHQDDRGRALCRLLPGGGALLRARAPTIVLTLLLAFLLFREARRAFGPAAGYAALLLAALEPNLLAHGSLATPDLPLAAFFFLAVLRFRRLRDEGGAANIAFAGIALGLALLSKYSALLLVGILPAAALVSRADRRFFRRSLPAALIALVLVEAAYAPGVLRNGAPAASLLFPAPYAEGIEIQRRANEGHRAFFLGRIGEGGWPAYYPVALLVKTPLPLLLLAAIGAGLLARGKRKDDLAWLVLPPLLYFLFFVFAGRIQIGVRYVLPVYPFLALLGGHAAAAATTSRARVSLALLGLWYAASAAHAYPHFLSYFNEAAGGSEGGSRILADSNIDWGQDLPGLEKFLEERGNPPVYLGYFGNDDPERYGIRFRFLPGWIYAPPGRVFDESLRLRPEPRLVAASRMLLQGVWLPDRDLYAWLVSYPRVATIGGSILVFDIGADAAAHERLARIYERAGLADLRAAELRLAGGPGPGPRSP